MAADGTDAELERLKAKRLAEMQKNLHAQKVRDAEAAAAPAGVGNGGGSNSGSSSGGGRAQSTPRDVVVRSLGFRGLEVLECAEAQYPNEAGLVVARIAEIIRSENIMERIDGGQLLAVFRMLGMPVKIRTSIKIQEDGKFVSLSDKLKTRRGNGDGDGAAGDDDDATTAGRAGGPLA